jgi:hypothetical protein
VFHSQGGNSGNETPLVGVAKRAPAQSAGEAMNYDQALKHAANVGASKAGGDSQLANVCCTLAAIHAINPRLVYEGAKKQGLTYNDVLQLAAENPAALGDLMFV